MSRVIDFNPALNALTITDDYEFGTMFASANELYNISYIGNDAIPITARQGRGHSSAFIRKVMT